MCAKTRKNTQTACTYTDNAREDKHTHTHTRSAHKVKDAVGQESLRADLDKAIIQAHLIYVIKKEGRTRTHKRARPRARTMLAERSR